MTESIGGFASIWLPTYLLHSTLFIVGGWGVAKALRLRGRFAERVWRVALLGGVVTATGATLAAPGPEFEHSRIQIRAERAHDVAWVEAEERRVEVSREERLPFRLDLPLPEREAPPAPVAPIWLAAWAIGALLGLGILGSRLVAERRLLSRALPAGPRGQSALTVLPTGATATLLSCEEIASPCALDAAIILVPGRCEAEMPDDELHAVVSHEWAHLRRRDPFWTKVFAALRAVLWVQPLNWVASRGVEEAAEEICDGWAVTRLGSPLPMASAIERVARWSFESSCPAPGVAMVRGSATARVRELLRRDARPDRRVWWGWLPALAVSLPALLVPAITPDRGEDYAVFVERRMVTVRADSLPASQQRMFVARLESRASTDR